MDTTWVAAVEQLPVDSRGFRRVLRLHAVALMESGPAPSSACGYQPADDELRPQRTWSSVTTSGRCALCVVTLRQRSDALDLPDRVDLSDRVDIADRADRDDRRESRRLTVVPGENSG